MAVFFDGTRRPRLIVKAQFGAAVASACVRGTGVRGTNVRAGRSMVDITADVQDISWSRGRTTPYDSAEVGTATVTVENSSGNYDPTNLSGAYVSGGQSLVDLGVLVTIQAEYPVGVIRDRFTGKIADISLDVGIMTKSAMSTVTFTLADGLEDLARVQLPVEVAQFTGDSAGERINNLADRANWPTTARAIDHGQTTLGPTLLGATALELMRKVELSELGFLFVDASGVLVFFQRHRDTTANRSVVIQANLTDTSGTDELGMVELVMALSRERIFNDVHVTRDPDPTQDPQITGSEPGDVPLEQIAQDATSIARYGTLSFPAEVGTLLASDPDARDLAGGLVDLYADAQVRIREVRVNALRRDLWHKLLPLTLLDRIAVSRDYGPNTVSADLHIQSVAEVISINPPAWDLRFTTSEPPPAVTYCMRGVGLRGTGIRGW